MSTWLLIFKYYLWQLNITGHTSEALQRVMYYNINLHLGILMGYETVINLFEGQLKLGDDMSKSSENEQLQNVPLEGSFPQSIWDLGGGGGAKWTGSFGPTPKC